MQPPFGGSTHDAGNVHGFPFAPQQTEELRASGAVREPSCANQDAEIRLRGDILVSSEAERIKLMEATLGVQKGRVHRAHISPCGKYSQAL